MGRKKKDRLMTFEILCPDTLHRHTERICRNFVAYEGDVLKCLGDEARNEKYYHENEESIKREFNTIVGYQTELRDGIGSLGVDMVSLSPISFEKSVKSTTPYIYRVRYYGEGRGEDLYTTRKDAVSFIQKKIKTRKVVMYYNGITEKCELDTGRIEEIFDSLENDTIDFSISQVGRNDIEGDIVLVTIFKNDMKN